MSLETQKWLPFIPIGLIMMAVLSLYLVGAWEWAGKWFAEWKAKWRERP